VVASSDDPFGGHAFAQRCAAASGSRIENIRAAGDINADSGLGRLPVARALLRSLTDATTESLPPRGGCSG
jgi:predicted alpha/beta hydrolase family esterase